MADAGQFQVELITGDAIVGSTEFEIHVTEMVFRTNDIGEQFVALQLSIFAVLGDEPDGDPRDRALHRDARVHQRQHSAAHARHRSRAVRFHDLARDANRVAKIVFARHDRLDRTFRQSAMTDLTPPGSAGPTSFANTERWKIVMQNETLRLFAAAVSVDHLRFFDRRQCGER